MRRFYANVDAHPKTETVFEFLEADDAVLGSGV
jgi:truncated hemoglobin YjbI